MTKTARANPRIDRLKDVFLMVHRAVPTCDQEQPVPTLPQEPADNHQHVDLAMTTLNLLPGVPPKPQQVEIVPLHQVWKAASSGACGSCRSHAKRLKAGRSSLELRPPLYPGYPP